MATFGRSFKPTSYLQSMAARRPPLGGRSMSNSSEKSSAPPSPSCDPREDAYNLSGALSPTPYFTDSQPPRSPGLLRPAPTSSAISPSLRPTAASNDSPLSGDTTRSTPTRSRPIAIELPGANKAGGRTPPPLSARGDLPGGYFPMHEQDVEQPNSYRPHPFQLDASKARKRSIQLATRNSHDTAFQAHPVTTTTAATVSDVTATGTFKVPSPITAPAAMAEQPTYLQLPEKVNQRASSRHSMPVASYNPSGFAHEPLPMGKYYPSNYEKWRQDQRRAPAASSASPRSASPYRQETSRITSPPTPGHSRHESDAKRRIQQYQRDMVAQATMLINSGDLNSATIQSLRSLGLASASRPSQPRLEPLGSPGPVTPMELGGSDSYLGVHGSPDQAYADEVARVLREEEERRRAQGSSSPAIELGPAIF